ncbi:Hsp90 co-chaperone Cdc37, partial [Fragariocoptes setiger]
MPIDYSKWKDIEISDDEDDTHPNIDTASLFRWRHQSRMERMKEMEAKKKQLAENKAQAEKELNLIKQKLEQSSNNADVAKEFEEAKKKFQKAQRKWDELEKEERLQPWNVDTISKPGWEKTIINKPVKVPNPPTSEEDKERRYQEFVKKYESKIKKFGMLSKWDECKKFLMEEPSLCCEETANYLTIWCLNLEIEEKSSLMEHVAKQAIAMQYMLELAKQLDVDARGCINSFFTRIQKADQQYLDAFNDEIEAFKQRIRERAKVRVEAAVKEYEEEERKKRLGPGGLDPIEVFETLPEALQKCFESKDVALLQETIAAMNEEDAKYHMKRCVDSGLWVPESTGKVEEDGMKDTQASEAGVAVYESVENASNKAQPTTSTTEAN